MRDETKTFSGRPSTPSGGNGAVFLQDRIGHVRESGLDLIHSFKHSKQNVCRHGKAFGLVMISLQMPQRVKSSGGGFGVAIYEKRRKTNGHR